MAVPYLILSFIVGTIAGGLCFLVVSPIIAQVGAAVLTTYDDDLQRAGMGTGQAAVQRGIASCESSAPHVYLGWFCMFNAISTVLQYVVPLLIGVIIAIIVLKLLVSASVRG